MTLDYTVRAITLADTPVAKKFVGTLSEFFRKHDPSRLPWSHMEKDYWAWLMSSIETKDGFMLLAERNGRPVGTINGWVEAEKNLAYPHSFWTFGFIKDFFVVDVERGQGAGKALMEAAVGFFRSRKLARVSTYYFSDEPSMTYYNQYGFREGFRRMDLVLEEAA
jgi:GNAT superfamily N-acetyltransferase